MTRFVAVNLAILCIVATATGIQQPSAQEKAVEPPESTVVNVLEPKSGARLSQSFVTVRFELKEPGAAAGTPTFQLRLDSQDPVETTSNEHTFTGLTPGDHVVSIELVDANGTPINGSRVEVRFAVESRGTAPAPGEKTASSVSALTNAAQQEAQPGRDESMPESGTMLPLLSLIGFGVLTAGIIAALRTR